MSFVNGISGSNLTVPSAVVYAALPVAWIVLYFRNPRGFESLGLQVSKWAEQPDKLLTHFLAHGSEAHLAGSVFGFVSSAAVWLSMQSISALHVPLLDAVAAVGGAVVSGVVGGVSATLVGLYFERLKFVEEHKWGVKAVDSLIARGFKTLRANRVVVCGGSAVVNGFAGFIFGVHDKYLNLAVTIAVDCVMLGASLSQKSSWGSLIGLGGQSATNTSLISTCTGGLCGVGGGSSSTSGGPIVSVGGGDGGGNTEFAIGHAAHIGGALLGFALGKVYRRLRFEYYLYKLDQSRGGEGRRSGSRSSRRTNTSIRSGAAPAGLASSGGRRLGTWSRETAAGGNNARQHGHSRRRSEEMGGNPFSSVGSPMSGARAAAAASTSGVPPINIPPPIAGPSAFESRSSTGIFSATAIPSPPSSEHTVAHRAGAGGGGGGEDSRFASDFESSSDDEYFGVRMGTAPSTGRLTGSNSAAGLDDTVAYLNQSSFEAYSGAGYDAVAAAAESAAHDEARRRRREAMGGDPFLGATQQSPRYR